jgi:hypothetical protein
VSKVVSISPGPVRRLSESNARGARLEHVRQCRFALRRLPPDRNGYQRVQLGRYARTGLLTGASVWPTPCSSTWRRSPCSTTRRFYRWATSRRQSFSPCFRPLSAPCCTQVSSDLFESTPRWVTTGISAITFVVMLIPDFTYTPSVDGVSNAEIGVLVVMHANRRRGHHARAHQHSMLSLPKTRASGGMVKTCGSVCHALLFARRVADRAGLPPACRWAASGAAGLQESRGDESRRSYQSVSQTPDQPHWRKAA